MFFSPNGKDFSFSTRYSQAGLLLLGAWMLVSIAALAAMYHLWWGRERILYLGKPISVQRGVVFQRAGLPPILREIEHIDNTWPMQMPYALDASVVDRSYLVYILSPRIPTQEGTNRIRVAGDEIQVEGSEIEPGLSKPGARPAMGPSFRALWLSVIIVFGLSLLIGKITGLRLSRLPELFALTLLGLTMLTIAARITTGSSDVAMWIVTALGLTGWMTALFSIAGQRRIPLSFNPVEIFSGGTFTTRLVTGLSAVLLAAGFFWSLLMACSVVPDDWDAWATWGPKAKYLALGEGPLVNLAHLGMSDYPLLWPSTWAFAAWTSGGWEEHWSKAWGAVLMALTAWEVGLSVKRQTGLSIAGWLGAAVFISVPCAPLVASWAYAESALWLMLACSFASLLRWRDERFFVDLLMTGIFVAAACHAKNEGIFFCLLVLFWIFFNDPGGCLKNISGFLAPVLLIYGPWFWWIKIKLGLVSATTSNLHFDAEHIGWALSRCPDGIRSALSIWMDVRQWNIVLFLISGAAVYALIRGGRHIRIDLIIPSGMLAGAFILNVFYDGSVHWMFGANWNRLTLQVIPLLLMTLFPYFYFLNRKTASL